MINSSPTWQVRAAAPLSTQQREPLSPYMTYVLIRAPEALFQISTNSSGRIPASLQ